MKPSSFKQQNKVLQKPSDMTVAECAPLSVYHHSDGIISCWRPSWRDRFALLFGFPLWMHVRGTRQPAIALETENPFAR